MRRINKIVIHCSASDIDAHDNIKVIDQWHKARGWSGVGYHWFIRKSGQLEKGRDEKDIGAHVRGHNRDSIGICFSGEYNFTDDQFLTAKKLVRSLLKKYQLETKDIVGHTELDDKKTCPNFPTWKITQNLFDA